MEPQQRDLRDELVAIIAAGRELPPENDYVLADIALAAMGRRGSVPITPRPTAWYDDLGRLAAPLGATLAALILGSMLLFHGASAQGPMDLQTHGPRMVDPDD